MSFDFLNQNQPFDFKPPAAAGAALQTLTGSAGIASSLTFGTPGIVAGPLTGNAGIVSSLAFGSGGQLNFTLVGSSGITSSIAFGSGGAVAHVQNVGSSGTDAGIPSSIAFGSGGRLNFVLVGTAGVTSSLTFGSGGKVAGPLLGVSGIASSVAFGSGGQVSNNVLTGVTGIPSSLTFGSGGSVGGSVGGPLTGVTGVPSSLTFGSGGKVAGPLLGTAGIASSVAFGSGGALITLIDGRPIGGIATSLAFGSGGSLLRGITGITGIPSSAFVNGGGTLLLSVSDTTSFRIFISSVDRTGNLRVGTLHTERQLNFSASGSCTLYDEASGYFPEVGAPVVLFYWTGGAWEKYFGGTIDSYSQVKPRQATGEEGYNFFEVRLADWGKSLSRRRLNKKYPASQYGTLTAILTDLSTIFSAEGIKIVIPTDSGITLPDIEFKYEQWNAVMDKLAQLSGLNWQVDWDKNLLLYDRPSLVQFAPFDVTETDGNIRNITVQRSRGLYRNVQYLDAPLAPFQQSDGITETYTIETLLNPLAGDPYYLSVSEDEVYDTRYTGRVVTILSVKLSRASGPFLDIPFVSYGGPYSGDYFIGQRNPNSIDFGWNLGAHFADLPAPGDRYQITFVLDTDGGSPNLVVVKNDAEIAARQAIEGGSGWYEDVFTITVVTARATLLDIGQKLIDRFSVMGLETDYEIDNVKIECGQQQLVTLDEYNILGEQCLVESISSSEIDKTLLRHVVKVSNAIQQQDALAAFQRLIARLKKIGKQIRRVITWDLATSIPGLTNPGLTVQNGLGNQIILQEEFVCESFEVRFRTAATGADIHIRVRADGTTIFAGAGYVSYTAGGTDTQTYFTFSTPPLTLAKGAVLDIDVLQRGSIIPGKDGVAHLSGWV